MNLLLTRVCSPRTLRHCAQLAICAIWIGLISVFTWLTFEASRTTQTKLPRSGFRIPVSHNVQIGSLRFQEVINSLAERYDQTASQCEQSIRKSAWRSFWLNLTSAFLGLLGLGAQWQIGRSLVTVGAWADRDHISTDEQGQRVLPDRQQSPQPPSSGNSHDGSFPEGAYGR